MAYASQSGRARVSTRNPQAFAVCDRCGFWNNLVDLRFQFDWAGSSMVNRQMRVCIRCYDTPQEQLRAIVIPADPVPVTQPRLEYFLNDPIVGIPVYGRRKRLTQQNNTRVTQQIGEPPYGTNETPGLNPLAPGNANPGVPRDFKADPPEIDSKVPETGPLAP